MKAILIIMDGVGDIRWNKKKTPLEAAKKPNMDRLAKNGSTGILHPIGVGKTPGSDTGHLSIFGYDIEKDYPNRGPLEALGAGISLNKGDIAFRANFATVKCGKVIDRRAGRIETKEAKKLEKYLTMKIDGITFKFKSTTEHRGVLIMKGKNICPDVTDVDPHAVNVAIGKSKPILKKECAKRTADALNKYIKKVIKILNKAPENKSREKQGKMKANAILTRGAGTIKNVKPFKEKHGLNAACIAGGALYKGVAKYIGMDVLNVKGATGDKHTDLKAKAKAAVKALKTHDFVFLHIKATDSFGHDGDVKGKTSFIEKIDKQVIPIVEKAFDVIVITGDHSTPWSYKGHSGHGVPILAYGPTVRRDKTKSFDEYSAIEGGLGHIEGKDVMELIKNWIKKQKKIGE